MKFVDQKRRVQALILQGLGPSARSSIEFISRMRRILVPRSFSDSQAESLFLMEFRLAGLRSVGYACAIGAVVYVAFGVVEASFGAWTIEATVRRLIAVLLLGFISAFVIVRPERVLAAYIPLLGVCSVVAIVGVVSVSRLLRDGDATALVNPVSLLALWVLYGFTRLPINVALLVGVVGSAFSMFGSRLTNMHEPGIRTVIYLVVANVLGLLLARSIELRERQLFLQRRVEDATQIELRRRSRLAEQASAEKTRLIAAVGHDLRQPMLAAVLHADVLLHRLNAHDWEGTRRQVYRVQESVKLLGATLDHVLDAAQQGADVEPAKICAVPLETIFTRLSELFLGQGGACDIEIRLRSPVAGWVLHTDQRALLRVLSNLVSNAIKFTPCRTRRQSGVIVRAFVRGEMCKIVVADTGIGISPRDMTSIWEPFFQVSNEERDRRRGLGLGLYLVKQSIFSLSGHTIKVRSTPGRGTRFVIELPATKMEVQVASVIPGGPADTSISKLLADSSDIRGMFVLLLEDDQEVMAAIQAQLTEWDVGFAGGRCVEDVMRISRSTKTHVDGIIADFRLPGAKNGLESILSIREKLGYAPGAVLITAESNFEEVKQSLPPATDFVRKPFDSKSLENSLRSVLRNNVP